MTKAATSPEPAGRKQGGAPPFQPGQSGNPAGRPKGSRNKLGEAFITALANDFETNGVAVIAEVREKRPHEYLKVVASLLPKQIEIKEGAFDDVPDAELSALIVAARSALGAVGKGGGGTEAPRDPKSAH